MSQCSAQLLCLKNRKTFIDSMGKGNRISKMFCINIGPRDNCMGGSVSQKGQGHAEIWGIQRQIWIMQQHFLNGVDEEIDFCPSGVARVTNLLERADDINWFWRHHFKYLVWSVYKEKRFISTHGFGLVHFWLVSLLSCLWSNWTL